MKVKKEKVKAWVYLRNYNIYGNLFVTEGTRLSDNLNSALKKQDLIPMTDCTIYSPDGGNKRADFLLLNVSAISFIHVGEKDVI